jgi:hypothetical protein
MHAYAQVGGHAPVVSQTQLEMNESPGRMVWLYAMGCAAW